MIILHYMLIGSFIASLSAFVISAKCDRAAVLNEERTRSKKIIQEVIKMRSPLTRIFEIIAIFTGISVILTNKK